jgi:hypothetical protein
MRPQVFDDGAGNDELARLYQNMLSERGAAAYRNVGPADLFQVPDRNTYSPDDTMQYRMFQDWPERI